MWQHVERSQRWLVNQFSSTFGLRPGKSKSKEAGHESLYTGSSRQHANDQAEDVHSQAPQHEGQGAAVLVPSDRHDQPQQHDTLRAATLG